MQHEAPINRNEVTLNKPVPQRTIVREFEQDNIVVQVQKTLTYHPYYAIIIGTRNHKDPTLINRGIFPLRFEGVGHIEANINNPSSYTLAQLMIQAIDFAQDCRQQDEDERIQEKITRETQNDDRGKQTVRKTGKTERERDKKRRKREE